MSINMSTDEVEYADHTIQGLNYRVQTKDGASVEAETEAEPVQENGIDNDELAELVAVRYNISLSTDASGAGTNGLDGEYNLGINTFGEREALSDSPTNNPLFVSDDNNVRLGTVEDPGILVSGQVSGVQENSVGNTVDGMVHFSEAFGSGPYVDKTDDLVFRAEVQGQGSTEAVIEQSYILYWNVTEMPEGRASFARP